MEEPKTDDATQADSTAPVSDAPAPMGDDAAAPMGDAPADGMPAADDATTEKPEGEEAAA